MSTWTEIRDQVKAAYQTQFTAAGAAPSVAIAWEDEPRPHAEQVVLLSVISTDELHDRDVKTGGGVNPVTHTLSTLMNIGIQVRCESVFNAGGFGSWQISEEARRGMFTQAFQDALTLDIQIAVPPESRRKASYDSDGHVVQTTIFEWTARAELFHIDPTTGDPMTSTTVDGTLEDVDESTITVPEQVLP